jgi:PIN domain nuclease of toxin-antitoxin system
VKRFLLDTHVVVWALTEPRRLGPRTRDILEHEPVFVSALSIWEMLLKHGQGRLKLPNRPVIEAITRAGGHLLPLLPEHAEAAAMLGTLRGDPIDRMLVGTARHEGMVFVTRDTQILDRAAPLLGELLLEA